MAAKYFTPSKLITAIRAGQLDDVIAAIVAGADIEEADIHGFVGLPLRTACFEGNVDIVRELLTRGADINAIASDGPGAPLRLAQRRQHQAVIALLLESGAVMPPTTSAVSAPTLAQLFPQAVAEAKLPAEITPGPEPESIPERLPALPDNMIEYTPVTIEPVIEEIDLTPSYGVDTNLLTFDLMRLQDEQNEAQQTTQSAGHTGKKKPKSDFWKS